MIQLCKLLLAHSLRAIRQPDGREADGFYEVNSTGVFIRTKDDVPIAFVSYASSMIQSIEPCQSRPGRYRGLGFLSAPAADFIGINRDSDDVGKIGHDFLLNVGVAGIRNPNGLAAYVMLYTTLCAPRGSRPEVFQCEAASSEHAIRMLYQDVPGALNVQHWQGRDIDRAFAAWMEAHSHAQ